MTGKFRMKSKEEITFWATYMQVKKIMQAIGSLGFRGEDHGSAADQARSGRDQNKSRVHV